MQGVAPLMITQTLMSVRSHFSWTTYPKFEILIFSIKLDLHPMKFSCYVVPQIMRGGNEKHPSSLMSYQVNIIAWLEHNRMTWTYCWLSQHWLRVLFRRMSVHCSGTPHHHWSEGFQWSSTACSNKQEKSSVTWCQLWTISFEPVHKTLGSKFFAHYWINPLQPLSLSFLWVLSSPLLHPFTSLLPPPPQYKIQCIWEKWNV